MIAPRTLSLPVQSMTGYAAASAGSPRGTLSLELRSVNSRFLDLQFRIADELRAHEPMLRELIGARVARGKVDCRLSFTLGGENPSPRLNAQALGRLKALADAASKAFPGAAPLRIADLLRWPGVIAEDADEESLRAAVTGLCRRALDDLVAARSREGTKLAAGILQRVRAMRERVEHVTPLVPQAVAAYQEKITERLREAIGSADDERIRTEVALFAARGDVAEELERLRVHVAEVERVLAAGGQVGKRLDFLAQELNREANTLASKAASQAISDCALELKLLVEQVREQVQNLE
ncbi:MAG TPA: YicC/YloC family endoribonuclease [Burkholderiales bacterium]|nr:YicC/YloC family endoribonuclease [Burkholderiales bacterium]